MCSNYDRVDLRRALGSLSVDNSRYTFLSIEVLIESCCDYGQEDVVDGEDNLEIRGQLILNANTNNSITT